MNFKWFAEKFFDITAPPEWADYEPSYRLSKTTSTFLDNTFHQLMEDELKSFVLPDGLIHGTDANNKWRTVSSMQKAIRFGLREQAVFAAHAAYDMDETYLFRRLAVTAVEDVCLGNPIITACTLAALSSVAWRNKVGGRKLACYLADKLASGLKDRMAVDMLIIACFNRSIDWSKLMHMSGTDLYSIATDNGYTMGMRMAAFWCMVGGNNFAGENIPDNHPRPDNALWEALHNSQATMWSQYVALMTKRRLNESMAVSFWFMDKMYFQSASYGYEENAKAMPTQMVGKLLGAAYDMHTREGKIAISKFKKENAYHLKPFLSLCHPGMEENLMQFGVFVFEGGLLNKRVTYDGAADVRSLSLQVELGYSGLPVHLHAAFGEFISSNLWKLNECRAKVLYAKAMEKQSK